MDIKSTTAQGAQVAQDTQTALAALAVQASSPKSGDKQASKLISWNVNGLRAGITKGFYEKFATLAPDVMCLQEIKLQGGQIELNIDSQYHQYWNYAKKPGYSGVAVFCKNEAISHARLLPVPDDARRAMSNEALVWMEQLNSEGRLLHLEFNEYHLINCYTPNAQDELRRIGPRLAWGSVFTAYVANLSKTKPVVICGDLNVAHRNIDLKNYKTNRGNAGFSNEERGDFSRLLASGLSDSFRFLHPDTTGAYSWWSFRGNARANNAGWRIDYWLVSNDIKNNIVDSYILPEYDGSDHCPVCLHLDMNIG